MYIALVPYTYAQRKKSLKLNGDMICLAQIHSFRLETKPLQNPIAKKTDNTAFHKTAE